MSGTISLRWGLLVAVMLGFTASAPSAFAQSGDDYAAQRSAYDALFARFPAETNAPTPVRSGIRDDIIALRGEPLPVPEKANFAGNYVLVGYGCGAECHTYAILNPADPEAQPGLTTRHGALWRDDSRLLIANPPANLAYFGDDEVPAYLAPRCYLFTRAETFTQIRCDIAKVSDAP